MTLRKITSFSLVGLANTGLHTGLVIGLVEYSAMHPVIANSVGFVVANMFSFVANSYWSFGTQMTFNRYGRFLAVSLVGLVATIIVSGLANLAGIHYLIGLLLVFAALPLLTFTMHYRWTFNSKER